MTTLHTLASGSSGNALAVSCGASHLLVDAGISCRQITLGLGQLGYTLTELEAIFITHTHKDHIAGLPILCKRTACPLLASAETCRELAQQLPELAQRLVPLPLCHGQRVGCFTVTAFPTAHDVPGACGFRLDGPDGGVGIMTDTGFVTPEAEAILPGVSLAVLEANHDVDTLTRGPYPPFLKRRILGPGGHLPNEAAAQFAVTLAEHGAEELILAHLSRENNTPAMALAAVSAALEAAGLHPALSAAPQKDLSQAHVLTGRRLCRR